MPRALLIEDEATARADLRQKLAAHPEIEIIAEAATVRSAREVLQRTDYDTVFLDVQLIGGNAFDLVSEVHPGARIIFVTAYEEHALRAFEINALDYLLKPVSPERLERTIARLKDIPAPDAGPNAAALRMNDTLYLRAGLRARFANVADIAVICAQDNYSQVWLQDGSKVFMRKTLKAWEDCLPPSHFMRVHRTQIVNLVHVTRYRRDGDEHTFLSVVGGPDAVPVSRDRWTEFRNRLQTMRPYP